MLWEMEPANLEKLLADGDYCSIFEKLEVEGLDIKTPDFIFNMHLKRGRELNPQNIDELTGLINSSLFEYNPCPVKIIKDSYFSRLDTYNFIVRETKERKAVGFTQVLSLEKTNAAYYSIATFLPTVRSMGFYSLSTYLSLIHALCKEHDYIVGRTMNPLVIEILVKYSFYYPKLKEEPNNTLISKAKEIMSEYMGREVEIDDRLVMAGSEIGTSEYVPTLQESKDTSVNIFVNKYMNGTDRLVLIRPMEEKRDRDLIKRRLSKIFQCSN